MFIHMNEKFQILLPLRALENTFCMKNVKIFTVNLNLECVVLEGFCFTRESNSLEESHHSLLHFQCNIQVELEHCRRKEISEGTFLLSLLPRKTERGEAAELENVGWVVVRDAQRPPELLGLP
jgi:hypothetical protein